MFSIHKILYCNSYFLQHMLMTMCPHFLKWGTENFTPGTRRHNDCCGFFEEWLHRWSCITGIQQHLCSYVPSLVLIEGDLCKLIGDWSLCSMLGVVNGCPRPRWHITDHRLECRFEARQFCVSCPQHVLLGLRPAD